MGDGGAHLRDLLSFLAYRLQLHSSYTQPFHWPIVLAAIVRDPADCAPAAPRAKRRAHRASGPDFCPRAQPI